MDKKVYYCARGNFVATVNIGRYEDVDGRKTLIGHKLVEFHPMGSGMPDPDRPKEILPPYGSLTTSDDEIINWIEKRRAEFAERGDDPDILTRDEFQKQVVPKTIQISELERRNIELKTQLAKVLADQKKIPNASIPKKRGRPSNAELAARAAEEAEPATV